MPNVNTGEFAFATQAALPSSLPTFPVTTSETTGPSSSLPSSSLNQAAEPSTPQGKGKGKRKGKGKETPSEEKRAARFKVKCPQNIMDRVRRVWQQRYMRCPKCHNRDVNLL